MRRRMMPSSNVIFMADASKGPGPTPYPDECTTAVVEALRELVLPLNILCEVVSFSLAPRYTTSHD
jgi:hypothetical protein